MRWIRENLLRPAAFLASLAALLLGAVGFMTWMPGTPSEVLTRDLSDDESTTREALRRHVEFLASGPRNARYGAAHATATVEFIERELRLRGWEPERQAVSSPEGESWNVLARRPGTSKPDELVVVGAHWDTRGPTPGADDNASGVAALLDLAGWLVSRPGHRSLELAFWTNEEPPHFRTDAMGSVVHARGLSAAGANVVGMLSLEMLGYFDPTDGAQQYPPVLNLFYPEHGAFVAFVGSMWHRDGVTSSVAKMRATSDFPVYGFAGPERMTGIGFSDQWSFWQAGYPGAMVTDTSFFRTPHYHQLSDVPSTIDFDRYARVVVALRPVVQDMLDR